MQSVDTKQDNYAVLSVLVPKFQSKNFATNCLVCTYEDRHKLAQAVLIAYAHLVALPVPEKARGKSSFEEASAGYMSAKNVDVMPL